MSALLERYSVILLDAYGVLVDKSGPLPGAVALTDHLNRTGKPYYILTNSASRLPEALAHELQSLGLAVPAARIITSGLALGPYFQSHHLGGRPCVVLGTEDSQRYASLAGGRVVPVSAESDPEIVILADQAGFALLDTLDDTLSLIVRRLDDGLALHLLLCNPDLIYPRGAHRFGFTAGSLAVMIEAVLDERYPEPRGFVRLGKPHPPIFEEAARRAGTRDMVMIGDQLATDIRGAQRFGIDSALAGTGLTRIEGETSYGETVPTYLLPNLSMS